VEGGALSKKPPWRVVVAGQPRHHTFTSRAKAYTLANEQQANGLQVSVFHWERNGWVLYERLRKVAPNA